MTFNRQLFYLGGFLLAATLIVGLWYTHVFAALPGVPERLAIASAAMEWAESDLRNIAIDGSVFKKERDTTSPGAGPLAKRFRLAGTFLAIGADKQARRAVIDIPASGIQQLVSEGEILDETVLVKSVFRDRVLLREGHEEENIWLSFSDAAGIGQDVAYRDPSGFLADARTLDRFGKRVGENRWVLGRDAVIEYYQELLDDTRRLARVFDSMKPVYEGDSIQGYVLEVEGEGEVFNAFGLKAGDIVRSVNSMPMTNRRRAEYFIREFVADRANAFVLDIEREGQSERLVYMLR